MAENLILEGWEDDEYRAFVEKFKTKKTTDDCYTPSNVDDAVADWVAAEYGLDRETFVRPFWPGGDYQKFNYSAGCTVVDNPPFSILSKIVSFYAQHGIRFFLFAPALTLFSSSSSSCGIAVGCRVTYENGADVSTSFLTNLEPPEMQLRTAPTLFQAVKAANDANLRAKKKELPKYVYPDNVLTAAIAQRWSQYGVEFRLTRADSRFIRELDAQRQHGKTVFGGGFLLGTQAAAERAAAERAAAHRWELSETEWEMVRLIDAQKEKGAK